MIVDPHQENLNKQTNAIRKPTWIRFDLEADRLPRPPALPGLARLPARPANQLAVFARLPARMLCNQYKMTDSWPFGTKAAVNSNSKSPVASVETLEP